MNPNKRKWNRGLDLFIESVLKPDPNLRQCAHNQKCYHELMDVRHSSKVEKYEVALMDFLKEIVKRLGMISPNWHQILMTLKNLLTQVLTFLMDLFQAVFLVVYLGIRLLPLLGSLALEKLFSLLLSSRTSLILTLMGIVYILTLKRLLISLLSK